MGIGIMNIAILLNPELVIIDGRLKNAEELLLAPIHKVMRRLAVQIGLEEIIMEKTNVVFGKFKENVISLGAACQVLEKIYKPPRVEFSFSSKVRSRRQLQFSEIKENSAEKESPVYDGSVG
jgi:hypothetical protein